MIMSIEELLTQNKNFIYKIASKYSKYYNIDDLFQVGAIGFIKAYKNYKKVDTKFTTYAYKYVLGEIIEFIKNDRTIKVSSDNLKLFKLYTETKEYLSKEMNMVPTLYQISDYLGIDEVVLADAINKSEFAISLEESLNNDEFTLEKVVGLDDTNNIDMLIDLKNELLKLKDDERKLIELRYFTGYTQSEVSNMLGMSQVQVSRCESKVLKKIKETMTV